MVKFLNTLTSLCSYGGALIQRPSNLFVPLRVVRTMSSPRDPLVASLEMCEKVGSDLDSDAGLQQWLIVGDGDLSYGAAMADELAGSTAIRLTASVLEEEEEHNQVYERSQENSENIVAHSMQVKFGIDATELPKYFPDTKFDVIEFNFPHWRGKTNNKRNRNLVDAFLKSSACVLKLTGEIRVALCEGQGGIPCDDLQEWRQSWMPAMYAAEHGLLLSRLEDYEPSYGLSSHRGVDRPFSVGEKPQKYYFRFPNGESVPRDLQISSRHELRIMLHEDTVKKCGISRDQIINGDIVDLLLKELVPPRIRFEIAAKHLLKPYWTGGEHVPLAIFLLNYSGENTPLTRLNADKIRESLETEITRRWGLKIAKPGRLVSRPYPFPLLEKLIKKYGV